MSHAETQILHHIDAGNTGTTEEIAKALGINKSTAFVALRALRMAGDVVQGPRFEIRDSIGRSRGYSYRWSALPTSAPPTVPLVQAALASRPALQMVWQGARA